MASFDEIFKDADSVIISTLGRAVLIRKHDGRHYECDAVIERQVEFADGNGVISRQDIVSFKNDDWPFIDKGDDLISGDDKWTVHNPVYKDESITKVFLR